MTSLFTGYLIRPSLSVSPKFIIKHSTLNFGLFGSLAIFWQTFWTPISHRQKAALLWLRPNDAITSTVSTSLYAGHAEVALLALAENGPQKLFDGPQQGLHRLAHSDFRWGTYCCTTCHWLTELSWSQQQPSLDVLDKFKMAM